VPDRGVTTSARVDSGYRNGERRFVWRVSSTLAKLYRRLLPVPICLLVDEGRSHSAERYESEGARPSQYRVCCQGKGTVPWPRIRFRRLRQRTVSAVLGYWEIRLRRSNAPGRPSSQLQRRASTRPSCASPTLERGEQAPRSSRISLEFASYMALVCFRFIIGSVPPLFRIDLQMWSPRGTPTRIE